MKEFTILIEGKQSQKMVTLHMVRGRRVVYIGLFPTTYRAHLVADLLEWSRSWTPVISYLVVKPRRQGKTGLII